jgi:hypothetical protein
MDYNPAFTFLVVLNIRYPEKKELMDVKITPKA